MAKTTPNSNVIAIELGTTAVRVMEVQWGGDGDGQILRRGSASLPASFWQDPAGQSTALSNAIREALLSAGVTGKTVVLSIPRWLVTLRFARLPHAPAEQMRGMVQFEAQQYILFPLEEVVLDYCPVEDFIGGDDLQPVLLAAVRRPVVQAIMGACERNGLEVSQITVSSLALAEHLRGTIETTALIHVEIGVVDVAVISNRQLLFSRSSQLDMIHSSEFANQRLREEIARTFLAYQHEFANRPIQEVQLSGEGLSQGTSLESLVQEVIEIPVRRLRARLLPPNEVGNFSITAGSALQSLSAGQERVNLLPTEGAERKAEASRKRNNTLAVAVGVVVVVGAVWGINSQLKAQEKGARELKSISAELDDKKSQAETRRRVYDNTKSIVGDLEQGLGRKHPIVDVMVVISKALPSSAEAWLTQMSFERAGTLTLRGESKSESAATDMVIALQKTGAFSEVHLGYMGDAQGVNSQNAVQGNMPKPVNVTPGNVSPLPGMKSGQAGAQPGIPPPSVTPPPSMQPTPQPTPQPNPMPPSMPMNMPRPSPFPGGRPPGFPPGLPPPGAIQIQGGTGNVLTDSAPVFTESTVELKGPNPGQIPNAEAEQALRATAHAEAEKRAAVAKQAHPIPNGTVMIQGGQPTTIGKVQIMPAPAHQRTPILITPNSLKTAQPISPAKVVKVVKANPTPIVPKPVVKPTVAPATEVIPTSKMSFVITCKLNPNAKDLIATVKAETDKKETKKSEH